MAIENPLKDIIKTNLSIQFFGAAGCVTGSCTLLDYKVQFKQDDAIVENQFFYLVDAGIYQNEPMNKECESRLQALAPKITSIFVTHAHLDHIGLIPKLCEWGFTGTVCCTKATRLLMTPMLYDLLKTQQQYPTPEDIWKVLNSIHYRMFDGTQDFVWTKRFFNVAKGLKVFLARTGHILGACSYYFRWISDPTKDDNEKYTVVGFSGDIGNLQNMRESQIMLKTGQIPYYCDSLKYLVLESTYGSRTKKKATYKERCTFLEDTIKETKARGGKVLIATFSLNRAQEVLLDLCYIGQPKKLPFDLPSIEEVREKYTVGRMLSIVKKRLVPDPLPTIKEKFFQICKDHFPPYTPPAKDQSAKNSAKKKLSITPSSSKKSHAEDLSAEDPSTKDLPINDSPTNSPTTNSMSIKNPAEERYIFNQPCSSLPDAVLQEMLDIVIPFKKEYTHGEGYSINVQLFSPLTERVNEVYHQNLTDSVMWDDGEISYKYLNDNFFTVMDISPLTAPLGSPEYIAYFKDRTDIAEKIFATTFLPPLPQKHKKNQKPQLATFVLKEDTDVIVSSSGMCEQGSILQILPNFLKDEKNTLILTGYQSPNTNGYTLLRSINMTTQEKYNTHLAIADSIRLIDVKSKIVDMSPYYSSHADCEQLSLFANGFDEHKNVFNTTVFLNHGSDESRLALKERLLSDNLAIGGKMTVKLPNLFDTFDLS